jgi:hypothetical protein
VYRFEAELWLYPGDGGWHFVTLPEDLADSISDRHDEDERGFGSLPVEVTVGATTWRTSIFPDQASASYLLPVKRAVRTAERLVEGDRVEVSFRVVTAEP